MKRLQQHIAVVDDDPVTRGLLVAYFTDEGFLVSQAGSADELSGLMQRHTVDLLLLDIRLPGKDGLTLTRELREKSDIGIILITSRNSRVDRILGLEHGADDYITKPFDERELLPRVRNLLRRVAAARRAEEQPVYRFGEWTLDLGRRDLRCEKRGSVPLTTAEFDLLRTFVQNPGRPLTRDRLLTSRHDARGDPFERTVDTLVRRLRRKIEADPDAPSLIVTVHGTGYVFTGDG